LVTSELVGGKKKVHMLRFSHFALNVSLWSVNTRLGALNITYFVCYSLWTETLCLYISIPCIMICVSVFFFCFDWCRTHTWSEEYTGMTTTKTLCVCVQWDNKKIFSCILTFFCYPTPFESRVNKKIWDIY